MKLLTAFFYSGDVGGFNVIMGRKGGRSEREEKKGVIEGGDYGLCNFCNAQGVFGILTIFKT